MADTLSTLLQNQNDRITALENATLDNNLILPLIEKVYDELRLTARIRVIRAAYLRCGQPEAIVSETLKNTTEYEEIVY